jgi:predicted O-methyltransferase YrrM
MKMTSPKIRDTRTSEAPSVPATRAGRFAAHVKLYLTRRFVTPFSRDSEYRKLDRWLTLGLLTHPSWWRIGGYMSPDEARTIAQFAADHGCKRIGQIGFLAGHFVCSALTILPDEFTVVSFDIGDHRHSHAAAKWISNHFEGRHEVIWGNSRETLRQYADACRGVTLPFDLIIVDGDHSLFGASADLDNVWRLARTGTFVFMDDLGTNAFNDGPKLAWEAAIKTDHIEPFDQFTDVGGHIFAVGIVRN